MAVVKQTYYLNEDLDMALKLRAVKDRMGYSDVVIAALDRTVSIIAGVNRISLSLSLCK